MSTEHVSINPSSSNDEESDNSTLLPTPTNNRHTTEETMIEKSSDDEDILKHLQTHKFKKKSISFARKRNQSSSTKYTQSTSDHEIDQSDGDETYEIHSPSNKENNKKKNKKHKTKLLISICIVIGCLLLTAAIVFAIYWYDSSIVNPTQKPAPEPEPNIDSELIDMSTIQPTTTEILIDEISTTSTYAPTTINPTTTTTTIMTSKLTEEMTTSTESTTETTTTTDQSTYNPTSTITTNESTTVNPITTTQTTITTTSESTSTSNTDAPLTTTESPTTSTITTTSESTMTSTTDSPVTTTESATTSTITTLISTTDLPLTTTESATTNTITTLIPTTDSPLTSTESPLTSTESPTTSTITTLIPTTDAPTTSTTSVITTTTMEPTPSTTATSTTVQSSWTSTSLSTNNPSTSTTSESVSMILRRGNTVIEQGITMVFPPEAFPDSIIEIDIGQADGFMKQIYDESTAVFLAMNIDDIENNYFLFIVENDPLPTEDISYIFNIPIPDDLVDKCPSDYGFEIFVYAEQNGFGSESWPLMVLYESVYNETSNSLTAEFYPEMWINKEADMIVSCTPGKDEEHIRRRRNLLHKKKKKKKVPVAGECHASTLKCPISGSSKKKRCKSCKVLNEFSRAHVGVDFASNDYIIAAANGIVETSYTSLLYGEVIVLRHLDGSATIYKNLDVRLVLTNDSVNVGDVIATSESHLHFEYVPNGKLFTRKGYIDPNACIIKNKHQSGSIQVSHSRTSRSSSSSSSSSGSRGSSSSSSGKTYDSFVMYIDEYLVCKSTNGQLNKCTINNLKCGIHELSIQIISGPNGCGIWSVTLLNGWTFADGSNIKNIDLNGFDQTDPQGWDINVPCN